MRNKKTITLASLLLLFAILIAPVALADNSCINCHEKLSAFSEKEKQLNEVRIKHLQRDVACSLDCHATTIDKIAKSNYEQWTKSKHALFNITCNNCHGGDPGSDVKEIAHNGVLRSSDINSTIFFRNVPETCGKCHANELKQFKDSKHYQKLKALKQAPTCDTCHRPHEFAVLNISEFDSLCSNCHNLDMKIAPDVPEKAITALQKAEQLKNEIKLADSAIKQAKRSGKETSAAESELGRAISARDNLPVIWHAFDLTSFGNLIETGIEAAKNAQEKSGMPVEKPPKTPGFGSILSITGFITIYLLLQRK